jgi:hypothetical protein
MAKIKAKGPPPLIIRADENLAKIKPQPGQKIIIKLDDGKLFEIKIEGKEICGIMGVA